jgi:hypothetical protein
MISREQAEAAVDGLEAALKDAGAEHPYALAERALQWVTANREMFLAMRSRETLVDFVQRFPDEAGAVLPACIALLQITPAIIETQIKQAIHMAAKNHPRDVTPGRPSAVDDSAKRDICDAVSGLYRKGVQLAEAQRRVAQQNGVGVRSIQRAWGEREALEAAPPQSIQDIWRAIGQLGK